MKAKSKVRADQESQVLSSCDEAVVTGRHNKHTTHNSTTESRGRVPQTDAVVFPLCGPDTRKAPSALPTPGYPHPASPPYGT